MALSSFFSKKSDQQPFSEGLQPDIETGTDSVSSAVDSNQTLISRQFYSYSCHPSTVLVQLLCMAVIWMVLSLAALAYSDFLSHLPLSETVGRLFNVNEEKNLPTVYSALVLFGCAVLLKIISRGSTLARRSQVKSWRLLSAIFLCLCFDEFLSIHEIFIEPVKQLLDVGGIFHFAWVIPAMGVLLLFFARFFRFWCSLLPPVRFGFALAAFIFVGGALGMEMVSGNYVASVLMPAGVVDHKLHWGYRLMNHVEEFCEMAGIAVFFSTLVRHICLMGQQRAIQFQLNLNLLPAASSRLDESAPV